MSEKEASSSSNNLATIMNFDLQYSEPALVTPLTTCAHINQISCKV